MNTADKYITGSGCRIEELLAEACRLLKKIAGEAP